MAVRSRDDKRGREKAAVPFKKGEITVPFKLEHIAYLAIKVKNAEIIYSNEEVFIERG